MKTYWQLFYSFLKIGTFTLGGGYAMLPLIEREIVEKKELIKPKDFIDMLAIAQSSPGLISINTAIFVGYKVKGFKGSVVTALGAALPSFFIILLVATFFTDIRGNEGVQAVMRGVRPAVVALIAAPVWRMAKTIGFNTRTIFIPIIVAGAIWGLGISPILVILAVVLISIGWGILKPLIVSYKSKKER